MKTKEKILILKKEGKNIPEICEILNIGTGTVGFHLKTLGLKWNKIRSEETKNKISVSQKGKPKKKKNNIKRSQEGYIDPRTKNYWPILNGEKTIIGTYNNSIRGQLKRFIIKNNIISYKCGECGCDENWRGKKMPLILDHINGIRDDHRLENLRFLCSNCDSIQDTYKSKNKIHKRGL